MVTSQIGKKSYLKMFMAWMIQKIMCFPDKINFSYLLHCKKIRLSIYANGTCLNQTAHVQSDSNMYSLLSEAII